MHTPIERTILRICVSRIGLHPQGIDDSINLLRRPKEQMTEAGTITASEPRDCPQIFYELLSHPAFFFLITLFVKNLHPRSGGEKIINVPMGLLLAPKMPLDPVFQTVQCRPDIDIGPFLKMGPSKFPNQQRGLILQFHDENIRPFHQKDIGIGSYKTDSDSILDDRSSPPVHHH
jgi:hypothetical protein